MRARRGTGRGPLLLLASILLFVGGAVLWFLGQPGTGRALPDVVLIVADDHDYESLGFMGSELAHTPALDELAAAGVVFTTAHVPVSRCRPSLASLLSGRWPQQHGIYYNVGPDTLDPRDTLSSILHAAGYATYQAGKFWEGEPRAFGFERSAPEGERGFARKGQEDLFRFLEETPRERPLFVWWAPQLPHSPFDPPQRYLDLFDRERIPVPVWFDGGAERYRNAEHTQLAMGAWFDDCLGQFLDQLRAAGRYENTLFVFLNDNGFASGHVTKGAPTEKAHRTPLVLAWPGRIPAGARFDDLVTTLDVYPTLLDYLGLACPPTAAGRSLRPRIEGREGDEREVLCGAAFRRLPREDDPTPAANLFAIYARTARWKYVLYLKTLRHTERAKAIYDVNAFNAYPLERSRGDQDLYDLSADPYERTNLAAEPEHAELLLRLRASAIEWWTETGGTELPLPAGM